MDRIEFFELCVKTFLQCTKFREGVSKVWPKLSGAEIFKQLVGMLIMGYARLIWHEDKQSMEYRFVKFK